MKKFSHAPAFAMQTWFYNLKLLVKLKWLQLLMGEKRERWHLSYWAGVVGRDHKKEKRGRERSLEDGKTGRTGGLHQS